MWKALATINAPNAVSIAVVNLANLSTIVTLSLLAVSTGCTILFTWLQYRLAVQQANIKLLEVREATAVRKDAKDARSAEDAKDARSAKREDK